jgi:hypothetical protein
MKECRMQYHNINSFFVFPDFSPLYRELHQSQDKMVMGNCQDKGSVVDPDPVDH